MLKVLKMPVEPLGSNCYLAWDSANNQAVIIDPGGEGERIVATVEKHGLEVQLILNTHGHGDHIAANGMLKKRFGVPILIHEADAPMLTDPLRNMSAIYGFPVTSPPCDGFLVPGEKIAFGRLAFHVLHTPGHSPGGVSLYSGGCVFTGDVLFFGSVGRYDLPEGDETLLIRGIREHLLTLPEETQVYPGHGQNTTIGMEKRCNPFLV